MFKLKRYLCIILIIMFLMTLIYPVCAKNKEIDFYESFDDESVENLDIVWGNETDEYGVVPIYNNERMYAIKTWVSDTQSVKITHTFENAISDGMLYVSFDYMSAEKYNDCFLGFDTKDNQYRICGFDSIGKFSSFSDFSGYSLDDEIAIDYICDEWYTVGVLFDLDLRKAFFYFGKKEDGVAPVGTVRINDDFGDITDMIFAHNYGDSSSALWDNIRLYNVNTETIEGIEEKENLIFDKSIYEKYNTTVFYEDFEKDALPDLGISSWADENDTHGVEREYDNGNYVVKTRVGVKAPVRLTKSFEKPLNSGLYYVTFDWLSVEGNNNDCFLRLMSGDKQYQICGFRTDGTFGKFIDFTYWSLNADTKVSYNPNQWYTVGVLFDFDLKYAYIYFGNKNEELMLIEKTKLSDDFADITDMIFAHSFGDLPDAKWDDIAMYKLSAETAQVLEKKENVVFDESVTEGITCLLSTDKAGNIFYNAGMAEINAKYFNRSLVYRNIDIRYEAFYENENIYAEDKSLMIESEGNAEYKVYFPIKNKYGFFTFNASCSKDSEIKCTTRLSNARTAEDGVRNPKLGSTVHIKRVKDKNAAFEILKNGGFSCIRGGQNDWQDVEKEKSIFTNSEENVGLYNGALNDGFEVLSVLFGSNNLYAEEYPTSNSDRAGEVENPPQSDGLIEKFEEYCYQTVVMYPEVKYFQIWNEWNNAPSFNKDEITDASYYAKVLAAGYDGVKRGAKERGKEALAVAMAPTGTKADWIEEAIKALNGKKCFDIVSVHPYTYSSGGPGGESAYAPEDECVQHKSENGNVVSRLKRVRTVLDSYGYTDVPIWASEFGFSSYVCGEEKQAQYAVRFATLCDDNNLLDKMIWYTFQNHTVGKEIEQNYGMIRYDENVLVPYEAKPVYLAVSNYNALMADAEPSQKICDGENDIYAYKFVSRDGDDLYAVWTTESDKEYTLNTGKKFAKVYDIYGNETVVISDNGKITLNISESMTYVKVSNVYAGLIQNGKVVTELKDITDEDVYITVSADEYKDCNVFVAQYKDDILLDVKKCEIVNEDIKLDKLNSETDRISIFIWQNMSPVCEVFTIM